MIIPSVGGKGCTCGFWSRSIRFDVADGDRGSEKVDVVCGADATARCRTATARCRSWCGARSAP